MWEGNRNEKCLTLRYVVVGTFILFFKKLVIRLHSDKVREFLLLLSFSLFHCKSFRHILAGAREVRKVQKINSRFTSLSITSGSNSPDGRMKNYTVVPLLDGVKHNVKKVNMNQFEFLTLFHANLILHKKKNTQNYYATIKENAIIK